MKMGKLEKRGRDLRAAEPLSSYTIQVMLLAAELHHSLQGKKKEAI
jgi:hypothetical protein